MSLQIRYERLVDLDFVEREGLQVGQRRISGAEIVHRDAYAQRLQAAQDRQATGEVFHKHALSDFQFQPRRCKPGFEQYGMYQCNEVAMAELDWREIDCDLERLWPRSRLAAGLPEHPFADMHDEAAFLRDRNEGHWRN